MKVIVTGAAGRIGERVCRRLCERPEYDVLGIDRVARQDVPFRLEVADLVDRRAVDRLIDRADAVVHLGNHAGFRPPDPQVVFTVAATCSANNDVVAGAVEMLVEAFYVAGD